MSKLKKWAIGIAVVLLLGSAGFGMAQCSIHQGQPKFEMQIVTLQNGTRVPCLFYSKGGGQAEVAGMSCDWSKAVEP